MSQLVHLLIKNPKDDETPIEAATQIFSSLFSKYIPWWRYPFTKTRKYAFELYLYNQTIYYYVTVPSETETFVQSLITSTFPKASVQKTQDPLPHVLKAKNLVSGEVKLSNYMFTTKTYMDFKDVDPMSTIIGFLSKRVPHEVAAIQILISPPTFPWIDFIVGQTKKMVHDETADKYAQSPQKLLMQKKISSSGGKVEIRLLTSSIDTAQSSIFLEQLAGTFGTFSLGEGSTYGFSQTGMFKKTKLERILKRTTAFFDNRFQVLNSQELATIWHPPGFLMAGIKNIAWGKTLLGEPPENLPVAQSATDEMKQDINFFATTEFKNVPSIFGLKTEDRRKHNYIIGKTGAGKSTLIANMAIDDIRKGRGCGIIDPHGDLSEIILDYIPNRRINDVVYLEPFDTQNPFHLNVLEYGTQHKDLIASGIVSIFNKLYQDSWGPRLEYILRNVILTLLEIPNSTLVDVLPLLSDREFRIKAVSKVSDPVIKNYWMREFDKMPEKLRAEAVSPIQNKVGQFVSSQMIRNIIGNPHSTIDLGKIMNEGKILILNLSQGKLGEDNAALLGAMIITQIQLAAMGRSYVHESERKDFFLYVDEFQNFATKAFIKILSEARKYRLSLTMANQYIDQLDETIQTAIFGNVGTLMSFVIGSKDAFLISKEFGKLYSEKDLVELGKFETVIKLSIDGMTSQPFPARTLPLPNVKNENREKIIKISKEKYGRKVK